MRLEPGEQVMVRTRTHPRAIGTLILLAVGGAIYGTMWFVNDLVPSLMHLPHTLRCAVAVLALAPVGLVLGMPFPTGMRLAEALSPQLVPWAWCINACTTVLGWVACILAAMLVGFTTVLYAAIALYAVALLALTLTPRPRPEPTPPPPPNPDYG